MSNFQLNRLNCSLTSTIFFITRRSISTIDVTKDNANVTTRFVDLLLQEKDVRSFPVHKIVALVQIDCWQMINKPGAQCVCTSFFLVSQDHHKTTFFRVTKDQPRVQTREAREGLFEKGQPSWGKDEVKIVTVDGVCILLEIKEEGDTRGCVWTASLSSSGCDVMCNEKNRGSFCVARFSPTK